MRRILLHLALFAVAIGLFLAFGGGGPANSPDIASGRSAEDSKAARDTNQDEDLPVVGAPKDADGTRSATDGGRDDAREVAGSVRIITGKVFVPASCAGDEELRVYAWSGEVDERYIQLMSTTGIGEYSSNGATLLASSPVDRENAYRLEMTTDLEEVHLFARGRFAYSEGAHVTPLSEREREESLETVCGACIEGELLGMGEENPDEVAIKLVSSRSKTSSMVGGSGFGPQNIHPEPDGRFTFAAVSADRSYEVRVEPKELAPDLIEVAALSGGETRAVGLLLRPGARVSGRVVDSDGLPVADARVRTSGGQAVMALAGWTERRAQTDESGEFSIVGLPLGQVMVAAKKDGYLDSGFEILDLREGEELNELELVLTEGNSIQGTVHWPDGEPVAGAMVQVGFDRSALVGADSINAVRGSDGSATTNEEGHFRVSALGHGPFTVSVAHAPSGARLEDWLTTETNLASLVGGADLDEELAFAWSDQVEGIRPDSPPLEFVLVAPEVVAGRVVDDVGAPVEKYELVMVRLEDSALGKIGVDTTKLPIEDPEGRFLAPGITPAHWNFYALAEGFSIPSPVEVTVPQVDGSDPLLITLEPASTVSGMVFTPSGAPATNAQVMVKPTTAGWLSKVSENLMEPTALSSATGAFRLEGLHSGIVDLIANAEGYATSEVELVTLTPGEETSNVRLVLRLGGTITGVLYDANGDLTSNATIQVVQTGTFATELTRTDSEGSFLFEHLEAGSWQVLGLPNLLGALSGSEENQGGTAEVLKDMKMDFVELEDGGEVHVVLGAPPEDPVTLTGVVRHLNEPVGGATLVLILEGEPNMPMILVTNGKGQYSANLDKPGDYLFTVQKSYGGSYQEQSQSTIRVSVPKTSEHHLDIDLPGAGIRGRVTTKNGSAVAGAPVTLYPTYEMGFSHSLDSSYTQVTSSKDGSFSIDYVHPGSYFLNVGGMSLGRIAGIAKDNASDSFGRARMTVKIGEDELLDDVNLVVEEGGSLEMRVVDSSGSPVSGASLFVRDEAGQPIEFYSAATTDSKGVCTYPGLSEGNYQVSARTADSATLEGTRVHVTPGQTESVELQLGSGTLLRVTMQDGEGNPVPARLRVVDSDGREHAAYLSLQLIMTRMGTDGFSGDRQVVGPLPPGRYRIHAYAEDGRETDKPVNLRGQAERTIRIRFR